MTREEEIREAAIEARCAVATSLSGDGYSSVDLLPYIREHLSYDEFIEESFVKGAEWADKHHKDNTPWISVKDAIPNDNAEGMCNVMREDGSTGEMAMRKVRFWIYPYIEHGYVTHWMPIQKFKE